jgi:retron-type reverse transcriptase
VDGLTWRDYEADLDRRIEDLHARVHEGGYRALPSRRRYVPKPDGKQRPLVVAHSKTRPSRGQRPPC